MYIQNEIKWLNDSMKIRILIIMNHDQNISLWEVGSYHDLMYLIIQWYYVMVVSYWTSLEYHTYDLNIMIKNWGIWLYNEYINMEWFHVAMWLDPGYEEIGPVWNYTIVILIMIQAPLSWITILKQI